MPISKTVIQMALSAVVIHAFALDGVVHTFMFPDDDMVPDDDDDLSDNTMNLRQHSVRCEITCGKSDTSKATHRLEE